MYNAQTINMTVAIAAALFSGVAVWFSVLSYQASVKPLLVFVRRKSDGIACWYIENVGRGAALNIKILDLSEGDNVVSAVRYYPVAAGAAVQLVSVKAWLLAATYTDAYGKRWYTTRCTSNENGVRNGNAFRQIAATDNEFDLRQRWGGVTTTSGK